MLGCLKTLIARYNKLTSFPDLEPCESLVGADSCHFNAVSTPYQRCFNAMSTLF